jgi:hypothetical protein
MTPIQSLAFLVAAILLWKWHVHLAKWLVAVPMVLAGWLLCRAGLVRAGGHVALWGADLLLCVDDWAREGNGGDDA